MERYIKIRNLLILHTSDLTPHPIGKKGHRKMGISLCLAKVTKHISSTRADTRTSESWGFWDLGSWSVVITRLVGGWPLSWLFHWTKESWGGGAIKLHPTLGNNLRWGLGKGQPAVCLGKVGPSPWTALSLEFCCLRGGLPCVEVTTPPSVYTNSN